MDVLQECYLKARLEKDSLLQILYEAEVSELVYHSNAIGHSTFNLEETDKILRQIKIDRFITGRKLFEAKNLARMVDNMVVKVGPGPCETRTSFKNVGAGFSEAGGVVTGLAKNFRKGRFAKIGFGVGLLETVCAIAMGIPVRSAWRGGKAHKAGELQQAWVNKVPSLASLSISGELRKPSELKYVRQSLR